jgi:hypothetical protein
VDWAAELEPAPLVCAPLDRVPEARLPPREELEADLFVVPDADLFVVPDRGELDPELEPPRLACGINHSFRPS